MSDCCSPRPESDRSDENGREAPTAKPPCPACGRTGRAVSATTLRSLARPEALARAGSPEGFRFCATPSCPVVWYRAADGLRLGEPDARVRAGIKEGPPPHPLCYCFEHTREEIEDEVRRTGTSKIPDEVTALCKQGLDRCEETNPRGACCLGDLREAVRRAQESAGKSDGGGGGETDAAAARGEARAGGAPLAASAGGPPAEGTADDGERKKARLGWWTVGASLGTALLASACCWLPLVAVVFGATATGAGAFFERWRPWLLALAAVTLGISFWLLFVRPARTACCEADGACSTAGTRPRKFTIALFVLSTLAWGAAAFFPSYVGALLSRGEVAVERAPAEGARTVRFTLEGLTCEGCASIVKDALREVPGVVDAEVSYPERRADVLLEPGADPEAVVRAVEEAGYRARPADGTRL